MNISEHIFEWIHVLISLGYIPRIGIAGTNGNSWTFWSLLNYFPKWLHHFILATVYEASSFLSLFWKMFSVGIEILGSVYFFQYLKGGIQLFSGFHYFWWVINLLPFPLPFFSFSTKCVFGCFSDFSLSLAFSSLWWPLLFSTCILCLGFVEQHYAFYLKPISYWEIMNIFLKWTNVKSTFLVTIVISGQEELEFFELPWATIFPPWKISLEWASEIILSSHYIQEN